MRDSYDQFQPQDRGRFGDNEYRRDDGIECVRLKDFTFKFVHETPKAILIETGQGREIWFAKSQIQYERKGETVDVTMKEWLAKQEKLI